VERGRERGRERDVREFNVVSRDTERYVSTSRGPSSVNFVPRGLYRGSLVDFIITVYRIYLL
jgi:hypothetical protein